MLLQVLMSEGRMTKPQSRDQDIYNIVQAVWAQVC